MIHKNLIEEIKSYKFKHNNMTDLEKFIDTYKQFGIDVKTKTRQNGNITIRLNELGEDATQSIKFFGFDGCCSDLEFTAEGNFINQWFLDY